MPTGQLQRRVRRAVGRGAPVVWTIPVVAPALGDHVQINVIGLRGDFDSASELVRISIGGTNEPVWCHTDGCASPEWGCYTNSFSATTFNNAIQPDGTLEIEITTTIAVDPNFCPPDDTGLSSWISLRLEYTGALPPDCNANGWLDSCEIAAGAAVDANQNGRPDVCETPVSPCPPDYNGDHQVDSLDLAMLLGAWGSTSSPVIDLTFDGTVDASDLAALLGLWGPCDL